MLGDFLYRIYAMQDSLSLVRTICDELNHLVPGDSVSVACYHSSACSISSICTKHPFSRAEFLPGLTESGLLRSHPFLSTSIGLHAPIRVISDLVTTLEWETHPLYCEFLKHDGVMDSAEIEFGTNATTSMTIDVLRSSRGFSDEDRATLLLLKRHFKQAFHNAHVAESLALSASDTVNGPASILRVAANGMLEDIPFGAMQGNPVPRPVQRWVQEQVQWLNRGVLDYAITPYIWNDRSRRVEFRLHRQWGHEGYLLCFRLVSDQSAAGVPILTPRERDVIRWLAEGKTNPEIAIILGLSPHTVKDYLKQIYVKLGVENRTAAVRTWSASLTTQRGF